MAGISQYFYMMTMKKCSQITFSCLRIKVVGAALQDSSIDLKDLDVSKPTILVLGNEGHGVRTNILKRCDALVKIRGRGASADLDAAMARGDGSMVDSLNVSVSGAILLHHILCNGRTVKR